MVSDAHIRAQQEELERIGARLRQRQSDEDFARRLQEEEEGAAGRTPSTASPRPEPTCTALWDHSTSQLSDIQKRTQAANERYERRAQREAQKHVSPSSKDSDWTARRLTLTAKQQIRLVSVEQQQQQQQQQAPPSAVSLGESSQVSHQPAANSPWNYQAASSLKTGQYGLIEPPLGSSLAVHGFELVKLLRLDKYQKTCFVEFLEPTDAPGPGHKQRFGRYQQLPDGKTLPQGWRGSLAFVNFFYSFKALEDGRIPAAVQDIIKTYTTERSRQIALTEAQAAANAAQAANMAAHGCEPASSLSETQSTLSQLKPSRDGFPSDLSSRWPPQGHQLPRVNPHSASDTLTELLTSHDEECLDAQLEPGCSSRSATTALRPCKRPRIAACLAVPSVRIKPVTCQNLEQDSDNDADYLPSEAEQSDAGGENSSEDDDDDGGFLEDMSALKPNAAPLSGRSTTRKAYRNAMARLQRGHEQLWDLCRYKLDPQELNQVQPRFSSPFFLYEQVYSPHQVGLDVAREIFESLYSQPPVILDSAPRFSAARRQRSYTTNIRGHCRLPEELSPNLEDFLGLSSCGLPAWFSELFEAGYFNTVNTRVAPSDKQIYAISSWVAQHPDQPLPESVRGDDGPTYKARKIAARYNLVPDKNHRVRGMRPEQAESLLGFDAGHTRRAKDNGEKLSDKRRRDMLGNSFQTDTVAHLLRPLKVLQDSGQLTKNLVVLSLFDGIGGAAVALEKAGVSFIDYISVEREWDCRGVVERYFDSLPSKDRPRLSYVTDCRGARIKDVRGVTGDWLKNQVSSTGIHLIIGGSPCNNITGSNRVTASRSGFSGEDSHLFSQYVRILRDVKDASPSMI